MATFEDTVSSLFQLLDGNGDAVLSKSEILKAVMKHSSEISTIIDAAADDLSALNIIPCLGFLR